MGTGHPVEISNKDRLINDFATRCFRDMADGDYIAARLAYRSKLFPQFLWLGHQAIEKYLKCILLQNRIVAKNVSHDLLAALAKLDAHERYPVRLSEMSREFVTYLNNFGGGLRYLDVSYYLINHEVLLLDHTVWDLRRYAEAHDFWVRGPDGKLISLLPSGLAKIRRSETEPKARFPGVSGLLEKIIADRKHPAREPLLWQNPRYGRARKTVKLRSHMSAVNAPLFLHPEIVDDVGHYVLIPKHIAAAYRKLAQQNAQEASAHNADAQPK
jgi:HEPN domain-containing protein